MDEKSYKNILIYYIGYVTIKKYLKCFRVNPLHLIPRYVSGYFEEMYGKKWKIKKKSKNEKLWIKIRDLIRSITKKSDVYDEKHMKIKFNSDNELPLNKGVEILNKGVVVTAIFLENNKYYPPIFLR